MDTAQLDVWSLVQKGYFDEACKKADVEYAQTGDIFPLRNKVYALFHLNLPIKLQKKPRVIPCLNYLNKETWLLIRSCLGDRKLDS